jgi:hypothetical protein
MSVFFLAGCQVSAITGACVGHLETDGVEHYLHVTEKRSKKRRKILLDAARPVLGLPAARRHRRGKGGHSDIRTTELYFVRKEEAAEVAARRIQIRPTGRKGE